jgi:hypothetical protein
MTKDITDIVDRGELGKQASYAKRLKDAGFDYGMVAGAAFVASMRNTYYKHTGTAIDELIDNAIEAGATSVHVALGYDDKTDKKPNAIAIIDNGHGMVEEMIRLSVMWGGTHREGSRSGLGRFGFGLPSASVNQAKRYSVYSKTREGDWAVVTVDLQDIAAGKYNDKTGKVVVPEARTATLPAWVRNHIEQKIAKDGLLSGTVVLWENLDRLTWSTTAGLTKNLLEHFGATFRSYLKDVDLFFDGKRVEPTDPLFTTPGFRYFDLDEDRAVPLPPKTIAIESKETGEKGLLTIRYASFPPTFFRKDKSKKGDTSSPRFQVAKQNAGIVVTRMGRQIDVIQGTPWKGLEHFTNDDRYWGMEIDFPAELDEEFTISNTKQGVVVTDRIWDILQQNGVQSAVTQLRKDYISARKVLGVEEPGADTKRPSEKAMEESQSFLPKRVRAPTEERERIARENLAKEIAERARKSKAPQEVVKLEVQKETESKPYRVVFEDLPGAPFFRVKQIGGQKVLYINQDHRFFGDVYAANDSSPLVRAALELLLFCIGEAELDAQGNAERTHFYTVERQEWSMRLASALAQLDGYDVGAPQSGDEVIELSGRDLATA